MNPLVEAQLKKIMEIVDIDFDDKTAHISIPQNSIAQNPNSLSVDCCYLVSVDDYILNPPDGFVLHTNWNNNRIPKDKVMKIDVITRMGKMIKVNSIGYDMKNKVSTNNVWEGWLPEKSITVIERL